MIDGGRFREQPLREWGRFSPLELNWNKNVNNIARVMEVQVELRSVLAIVLPTLGVLSGVIVGLVTYIVRRVVRRIDELAPKLEEHNSRLASLERGESAAGDSITMLMEAMDSRFAAMSGRYGDMQRDIDELRADLREIRGRFDRSRVSASDK